MDGQAKNTVLEPEPFEASPVSPRFTVDASDPAFYAAANHDAFTWIHDNAPVYFVEARYTEPFWNISKPADIRLVGGDPETFSTKDGTHLNDAAFAVDSDTKKTEIPADPRMAAMKAVTLMDPIDHRRVRLPLNAYFRPGGVAQMETTVRQVVTEVLDDAEVGVEIDFMAEVAGRIPLLAIAQVLGIDPSREGQYREWVANILRSFEPGAEVNWSDVLDMIDFFEAEIKKRQANPRDDLISMLVEAPLRHPERVMWCWILLVAGMETTGSLIGAGMELLLLNPDQKETLIEDRGLIANGVAEMLRYITPGRYQRRTAARDVELRDASIREGDAVCMNLTVANFDPDLFPDPYRFDVRRTNANDALAFSAGPHYCVGLHLARLEARIAFEELLERYPNSHLAGPVVVKPTLTTYFVESMPLVLRAES